MALMVRHAHAHKHLHKNKKRSGFENFIYVFAFTTPLFEIPQFVNIIGAHSAENVSLITWLYLAISSFAWLVYGILMKMKPLIVSYVLYVIVEFSIVVSILMYQ
jgi:uncharacterized protein with PQ loop repeat